MRFTSIIYLDPAMISLAFEELKGVAPVTRITRREDLAGSIGAGVFRLGGTSSESKEFAVSSAQMFFTVESQLREFPKLTVSEVFERRDLFWIDAVLGIGEQNVKRKEEILHAVRYFVLADDLKKPGRYLDLATNDAYFTSGFDRMADFKETLGSHIWEPVEALLRPIYSNPTVDVHLFSPVVILRR
jgi:hypothetical protein